MLQSFRWLPQKLSKSILSNAHFLPETRNINTRNQQKKCWKSWSRDHGTTIKFQEFWELKPPGCKVAHLCFSPLRKKRRPSALGLNRKSRARRGRKKAWQWMAGPQIPVWFHLAVSWECWRSKNKRETWGNPRSAKSDGLWISTQTLGLPSRGNITIFKIASRPMLPWDKMGSH